MYQLIENGLTAQIYTQVREQVGFPSYDMEDAELAVRSSTYSVVVMDGIIPIGIGRVISDGRIVFFLKDIVVIPAYQKQGVGKLVLTTIMNYISRIACKNAYVGLMSTPGKESFYEQFGFVVRPSETTGSGMNQYINQDHS